MGRPLGSTNKILKSEVFPLKKPTNNKAKFWITTVDFINYCLSHSGHKQQYFNKNYGMTYTGKKVGLIKVSEDVFRDVQREKIKRYEAYEEECQRNEAQFPRSVGRGIL